MYDIYNINSESIPQNDVVLLKIVDQLDSSSKYGNIHLPGSNLVNVKALRAEVVKLGSEAKSTKLKEGDIILYDKYSAYFHPPEKEGTYVFCNVENIICKLHKKTNKILPYGDNALIKIVKNQEAETYGNIVVADSARYEAEFYIIDAVGNKKTTPVNKGDRVCLHMENFDIINFSNEKYIIIPYDNIIAKVIE